MTRKSPRNIMILTDFIYGSLLLYSIVPATFSIMFADGGSSLRVHIQILSLLTLPVVLLIALTVPWIFYRLRMQRMALTLLFLPFVNGFFILFYILLPAWRA